MEYVEIHTGTWRDAPDTRWVRLRKLLVRLLPSGNPDHEGQLHPLTRSWWIELDCNRIAQREIGFDERGVPIVLGPVGWYRGFAIDDPTPWSDNYKHSEEASQRFQETWDILWPRFAHLENKESQQDAPSNGG